MQSDNNSTYLEYSNLHIRDAKIYVYKMITILWRMLMVPLALTLDEHRRLPPAKPSCVGIHKTHTHLPATSLYCVLHTILTHIWCYISHLISENPLCTTSWQHSQAPTLPTPASTSKLQVFSWKCAICTVVLWSQPFNMCRTVLPSLLGSCLCHWQIFDCFTPNPFSPIRPVVFTAWFGIAWWFLGTHML